MKSDFPSHNFRAPVYQDESSRSTSKSSTLGSMSLRCFGRGGPAFRMLETGIDISALAVFRMRCDFAASIYEKLYKAGVLHDVGVCR